MDLVEGAAPRVGAVATTREGNRIHVDPTDPRGQVLIERSGDLNPHSRRLWHLALRLARWDVVVDVGVNYGEMLVGAPLPDGAQVVAFEPNPAIVPHVRRTLEEAGLRVDLRTQAVGAHEGTGRFAVDTHWSGTSSLRLPAVRGADVDRWVEREVEVTTLDAVVPADAVWVAKVDVEGAEAQVFAGATASMARGRTWAIMVEVLHAPRPAVAHFAECGPAYLLDTRTGGLVRLPGGNAEVVEEMLACEWLYPQDLLVLSRDLAMSVDVP